MITIRAIAPEELEAFRGCVMDVFAMDPDHDPHGDQRLRALLEPARTYCAFDGDTIVATSGTYAFDLMVCGGRVPMAGLTMVTVRPTHRRRGILRRMIEAHLADAVAHGEPVSGLWASDAAIYGRFGYGVAAEADEVGLTGDAGFARPPAGGFDALAQLDDAAAAAQLPALYARAAAARPGMMSRPAPWWTWRRFTDRPDVRKGRSPRRHVVCRRGDDLTGYVVFRQKLGWDDAGHPDGSVDIEELIAVDAAAEATLWHHVTHIDLFPKVSWWNAPVDALAPWLAADRRRVVRKRNPDTLWIDLVDVAGALAARRYLTDGAVVLGVRAPGTGEVTRWALTVEDGAGRCVATTAAPQLELDLATLGSIYLGGFAPSLLARAGAIRGDDSVLARADQLFRWPVAPWCAEVF